MKIGHGEIENPVLEIKIKKALLGKKKKYALHPFRMEPGLDSRLLATLFNQSHLPDDIAFELKMQEPCLVNRYRRKYYQRADGRYRITVDDKLQFCAIGLHHNYFMNRVYDRGRVILELKYEEKYDNNSQWITNHFPFRMTRMSKYVRGIDLLNR